MSKTFGVTGATGYIGGFLVEKLLKDGHSVKVYSTGSSYSDVTPKYRILEEKYKDDDLELFVGSDRSVMRDFVFDTDVIFHLGALYEKGIDYRSVENMIDSNITTTSVFLSLLSEYSRETSFIGTSTFSALDSDGNYSPQTFYAATRYASELLMEAFPVDTAVLRLSDTYGPNDSRPKLQNIIRNKIILGEDFKMNSQGSQQICLTHVNDVVDAFIHAASLKMNKSNSEPKHDIYDIFYPENRITLSRVAELFSESSFNPLLNKVECGPDEMNATLLPKQKSILPNFSVTYNPERDLVNETFSITDETLARIVKQ